LLANGGLVYATANLEYFSTIINDVAATNMVASVACVEVQYVVAAGGMSIVIRGWAGLAAARGTYRPRKQQEEPSFENF